MFRGMEPILRGRDPREPGCSPSASAAPAPACHALASVRAVENALGVAIPTNARLVRNLLVGSRVRHDHVVQLLPAQLPDWVDPPRRSAPTRRRPPPSPGRSSDRPRSSTRLLPGRPRAAGRLRRVRAAGPFVDAVPAHRRLRLSPEPTLHGDGPLPRSARLAAPDRPAPDAARRQEPASADLPGRRDGARRRRGVARRRADAGSIRARSQPSAPAALSAEGLTLMAAISIAEARAFVEQVYVPDVLCHRRRLPGVAAIGRGIGQLPVVRRVPAGRLGRAGAAAAARPDHGPRPVRRSSRRPDRGRARPSRTRTTPTATTTCAAPPVRRADRPRVRGPDAARHHPRGLDRYSWIKAPRYGDDPMEVGPLARMLVAYAEGGEVRRRRSTTVIGELGLGPDALFSTLGRMLARAIEAEVVADGSTAGSTSSRRTWPAVTWRSPTSPAGTRRPGRRRPGLVARRGPAGRRRPLGDDRGPPDRDYQVVDGSTWNASPRDDRGRRGAIEEALVGTPVRDPGPPGRDPADRPLVRPLHGLRGPLMDGACSMTALTEPVVLAPAGPRRRRARGAVRAGRGARALYIWQLPVRFTHWLTAGCIVVLSLTGGYIADPFLIPPGGSVMTTVRPIHIVAAIALLRLGPRSGPSGCSPATASRAGRRSSRRPGSRSPSCSGRPRSTVHPQGDPQGARPQPARRGGLPRALLPAPRRDHHRLRPRRAARGRARRAMFGWLLRARRARRRSGSSTTSRCGRSSPSPCSTSTAASWSTTSSGTG